jgi:hypothetical protein
MSKSNSSIAEASFPQKVSEAIVLLRQRPAERDKAESIQSILDSIDDYRWTYERVTGGDFAKARVFEIGFGARPLRLIALMSMAIDVRGIDLDMPMLQFSVRRLGHIFRQNGLERALKTGVRALLFDRRERRDLEAALNRRGYTRRIDPKRFLVGDVAECGGESGSVDMVYSNNVFEHIPPVSLERVIERFAKILSPQGIAIITPDVFTGICGGHLLEWYKAASDQNARVKSEAWEHLRKQRYVANTYLNRLTRSDYRRLFKRHFDILQERVIVPSLGRDWLTPGTRAELKQWDDEELFSNRVQFVLRPKAVCH